MVASLVVLFFALRVRHRGWAVALGLLLAGVTGNLVDRVFRSPGPFRGHVVDFFALPHWPVFNVADMCIDLAGALFVILLVRGVRLDGSRHAHDARLDGR
jgi:signal peptidase II